ncbi:MAG: hydroxymethylbilane synthase [Flavobacteriales bacterium]
MHIKIGTRKSKLALWQANHVAARLKAIDHTSELVLIESEGDKILDTPLPLIGGKGIFTKALDDAILNHSIDLAVHSFKDIPTELEHNLTVGAILEREKPTDALIVKDGLDFLDKKEAIIASSSNRRRAQWLHKYPTHKTVDIRGNVPTRIEKLQHNSFDATILACAGLIRLNLENHIAQELDWMVSAPAQGAVAIICHSEKVEILSIIEKLNHHSTAVCTLIEREFLNILNGGCSAPVGAYAYIENETVFFKGVVLSNDGKEKIEIKLESELQLSEKLGQKAAEIAIFKGAKKYIDEANLSKNG